MASVKLPLHLKAQVASVKLPLHETVWLLNGFILQENIIKWHTDEFVILENIKSFITTKVELVDKNHIKIKWFGDSVPKVQIFRRLIDEEYTNIPYAELPWTPNEYNMILDTNSYVFKIVGIQNTGSGQEYQVGNNESYDVNMNLELPRNEKHYYIDLELKSVYRIEVNI